MDTDVLAQRVVMADDDRTNTFGVSNMLRRCADTGVRADAIVSPDLSCASDDGVTLNKRPSPDVEGPIDAGSSANFDAPLKRSGTVYRAIWTDPNVFLNDDVITDRGTRMDKW